MTGEKETGMDSPFQSGGRAPAHTWAGLGAERALPNEVVKFATVEASLHC